MLFSEKSSFKKQKDENQMALAKRWCTILSALFGVHIKQLCFGSTVEVRLSGTRLTGKFDQPDLIGKKINKIKGKNQKTLRS